MMPAPNDRRDDSAVMTMLSSLNDSVLAMRKELSDHMASEPQDIADAIKQAFAEAFPNGEPGPHKDFHQSIIDRNKWLAEVFKEAAKHIAKYGLLAFIAWLFWHGVQDAISYVINHAAHK